MNYETKLQIQAALIKRGWKYAAMVINEFIEALESTDEQKQLRADAERYRWLRNADHGWYVGPEYSTYNDVIVEGEYLNHSVDGLDEAIDKARES